uniref:threonine--tRNA ligase n=1 Tax=Cairina moschata TaxID=8855 RepID=A0A8C3CJJ7_CAIMO
MMLWGLKNSGCGSTKWRRLRGIRCNLGHFEVELGTQNGGVLGSGSRCPKAFGDPQKGPSPRWRPGSGPEAGPRPGSEPGPGVGAEPGKLSPPRGRPRRPPAAGRGGPGPAMPPALTGGRLLLGAAPRRYRVRRAPCLGWGVRSGGSPIALTPFPGLSPAAPGRRAAAAFPEAPRSPGEEGWGRCRRGEPPAGDPHPHRPARGALPARPGPADHPAAGGRAVGVRHWGGPPLSPRVLPPVPPSRCRAPSPPPHLTMSPPCPRRSGLAASVLVARVNGALRDLEQPLEDDTELELLDFAAPEGRAAFWQSSAFVLGAVLEQFYGATLCSTVATEDGFFCDAHMGDRTVQRSELPALEDACMAFARAQHRFERLEATREQLGELFKHNSFQLQRIQEEVTSPTATVYRCGPLLQLCRGPLLGHTGLIGALRVLTSSAAFWGDPAERRSLQRVAAVAFPSTQELEAWQQAQDAAALRDHRRIGRVSPWQILSPGKEPWIFGVWTPASPAVTFS